MGKKVRAKQQAEQPVPPILDPPPHIAAAIDRASEGDRIWFERHPDAAVRRRPPIEGEFWPQNFVSVSHVVVYHFRPGFRLRLPCVRVMLPESERIQ